MADEQAGQIDGPPASRWFLIAVVVLLLVMAVVLVRPYLGAVVLALLSAFILHPIHKRLVPLVRWPTLSATVLMVVYAALLVAPFVFIVWRVYEQLAGATQLLQDPMWLRDQIHGLLAPLGVSPGQVTDLLTRAAKELGAAAAGHIVPAVRYMLELLLALVVFFFVLFFALRDGEAWVRKLKGYTPLVDDDRDALFEDARDSVWAIVMGTFVVAAIQGAVAGVGWWLFGFPAPLFWGFVMVVLGILPFGAPFVVTVPASIIAMFQGDWFSGIGLLVYTLTVVALTDDVLRPYLVGSRSGVQPVLVLVGMLGGLAVFGVAGFVIGPLVFALLGPMLDVWAKRREERVVRGRAEPSGP